ncbi:MAG: 50S ribosomal protein L22 [Proteobacteria bacterium]|nr:50S ribosomal protein L22 [Pseudomonadota bacterium]
MDTEQKDNQHNNSAATEQPEVVSDDTHQGGAKTPQTASHDSHLEPGDESNTPEETEAVVSPENHDTHNSDEEEPLSAANSATVVVEPTVVNVTDDQTEERDVNTTSTSIQEIETSVEENGVVVEPTVLTYPQVSRKKQKTSSSTTSADDYLLNGPTATAKLYGAQISARKSRLVADLIRGLNLKYALYLLASTQKKAAKMFHKLLRSAQSNAKQMGLDESLLVIKTVYVNEGPSRSRWRPRARGKASMILNRSSHMVIELCEASEKYCQLRNNKRRKRDLVKMLQKKTIRRTVTKKGQE